MEITSETYGKHSKNAWTKVVVKGGEHFNIKVVDENGETILEVWDDAININYQIYGEPKGDLPQYNPTEYLRGIKPGEKHYKGIKSRGHYFDCRKYKA